jgi:hypothetical protein
MLGQRLAGEELVAEGGDGAMEERVFEAGGDFGEWGEDEEAGVEMGVREREAWFVFRRVDYEQLAVLCDEQEIEIEGSGQIFFAGAGASVGALDGEEFFEEVDGVERSAECDDGVEVVGLRWSADGRGLVERGLRGDGSEICEGADGGAEMGFAVAEIGAESDVCGGVRHEVAR